MKQQRHHSLAALVVSASFALAPVLSQAGVTIHQTPLMVTEPVPPNIMLILDDSGSMAWEHMPGTTANWHNDPVGGLPKTVTVNDIRLRASNINTQWYNPLVTYEPWLKWDGSSYGNINYNSTFNIDPSQSTSKATFNFQTQFTAWKSLGDNNNELKNTQTIGAVSSPTTSSGMVAASYRWRYGGFYYLTGNSATSVTNYTRYDFMYGCSGSNCTKKWNARQVTLNTNGTDKNTSTITNFNWTPYGGTTRTVEQELQNYANWFVYYRTRINMAKAAISRTFAGLTPGYRIGFDTLQYNAGATKPLGFAIPVGTNDGKFQGTNKQNWFAKMFAANAYNGTSLRETLDRSGKYFSDQITGQKGASGPYGPETGASRISCRSNFAILTTDGYWNGNAAATAGAKLNTDGTDGPTVEGVDGQTYTYKAKAPYKDAKADTLADVAMYYWKNDLMTDLLNNVPTTGKSESFWQNMRTYGISIGEKGTLDPTDKTTVDALYAGTKAWPAPGTNPDKQENIDDLWHASINSRGEFIVAKDPDEFTRALTNTLMEIASETKSEASGGTNEFKLSDNTKAYFSRYTSGQWDGDVFARSIDKTTGKQDLSNELWTANAKLPAWASRNIWVNNNGTFQKLTGAVGGLSADIVNYLRGNQSKEEDKLGGTFRKRTRLLPAFVNSQLVYVGGPSQTSYYDKFIDDEGNSAFEGADTYNDYAGAAGGRTHMIYVAGNNGMLHGFNAETGEEKFAFLTRSAITSGKLQNYVQPNYGQPGGNPHQYILDGELTVADANIGGWRTILVGTQGRGGSGVFALDVTDPNNITLLWEKNSTDNSALGNNLGKPIIVQVAAGDWRVVFGNGPNSTGDKAQLIMISLSTGAITTVDTGAGSNNGLMGVALWDDDQNGFFETAYAGDLKGNLWRFDNLGGGTTATKVFSAPANQVISAAPLVVRNNKTEDTWVFIGTGRYLNIDDLTDNSQQAWYGLIEKKDGVTTTTSSLFKREMEVVTGAGAVLEAGTESDILHNEEGKNRGWYINFPNTGERMLMTPNYVLGGALFGFTFIPSTSDPCVPQGSSALWGINPFSGGRIEQGIFLGDDDQIISIDGLFASVIYGIPVVTTGTPPITIGDDGSFGIQGTRTQKGKIPTGEPKRESWREIVNQ